LILLIKTYFLCDIVKKHCILLIIIACFVKFIVNSVT
jgi:hypothetical protein